MINIEQTYGDNSFKISGQIETRGSSDGFSVKICIISTGAIFCFIMLSVYYCTYMNNIKTLENISDEALTI
jgi:hypothetical protein